MNNIYVIVFIYKDRKGYIYTYTSKQYFKTIEEAEEAAPKLWKNLKNDEVRLINKQYIKLLPYKQIS